MARGHVVEVVLVHVGVKQSAVADKLQVVFRTTNQTVGVDVLEPDEDASDARSRALLDKVRDAMAQRVYLDDEANLQSFNSFLLFATDGLWIESRRR